MKKIIAGFLALLFLFLSFPAGYAADSATGLTMLKLNPYGGEESAIDTIRWFAAEDRFFLFLPADTDPAAATVYFDADAELLLDGEPLCSGGSAAALTEGDHSLLCGGNSYPLTVCRSAALPAVYLRTESGSLDYIHASQENREPGSIRVYEAGVMTLDKDLKQIKGRGNSTWRYSKKPYNIKFDKKTDLFGMGKAKKWSLLANYIDQSLIHNASGWAFAEAFGMPFTSEFRQVDLYINGEYLGNYTICESVEIGETRVNIPDLEKANENANPGVDIEALPRGGTGANNNPGLASEKGSRKWVEIPQNPEDISGGYLLEYDYMARYDQEISGFVTKNGQPVVIKSPEYASREEVSYIADFMEAATEALYSPTGRNAEGRSWSEYFDVDSLAAAYLEQELSMNYDAGFSSFFAYKPAGEDKIHFGPIWDMDNAFGSPYSHMDVLLLTTDLWWANQMAYNGIPSVLAAACRHAEFRNAVKEKWEALDRNGALEAAQAKISALADAISHSAVMNALRWNTYQSTDPAEAAAGWSKNAALSINFTAGRLECLRMGFALDGAYLYYDMNGATGGKWASVSNISAIGATVTVRDIRTNGKVIGPPDKLFWCWSTEPDGSGACYQPGDQLELVDDATVLYAIWKTQREIDSLNGVNPFTDVVKGKYYYTPVLWAFYHDPQITSGTSAGRFSPGTRCTREQVLAFLYAACGKPAHTLQENPFTDLRPGKYYYDAVLWAYENGLTSGIGGKRFGVGRSCTREQTVTFLWKALGCPEPTIDSCRFTDVNAGKYYYQPVLWAAGAGVTGGISQTRFGVGNPCTRAQVVTFLWAAFGH